MDKGVYSLKKEPEESKRVCPECDSELIVDLSTCPICGNDLPIKDELNIDEAERPLRKKMTLLYNLIFWAEELKIDTRKSYGLLSQAWDELKIDHLEESEKFLDKAFEEVFAPIVKGLKADLRKKSKDVEKADLSKEEISGLGSLLRDVIESKEEDDLDEALSLLIEYKRKSQ